jgi:hypothetical protein
LLLDLASAVVLRSDSRGTHDHILLSQIRDSPNLKGQVRVFISPSNKVTQLYPQALGSLFFASYDSQGYNGGIRTRLHADFSYMRKNFWKEKKPTFFSYDTNRIEKHASNNLSLPREGVYRTTVWQQLGDTQTHILSFDTARTP